LEDIVKNRVPMLGTVMFLLMYIVIPNTATAGLTIEEVKENVEKLWKPIRESQPHVTAVEFKKILDSEEEFVLVDVRTSAEFDSAHLPGAMHINRGLIEWVAPKKIQDTDAKIYVYCRTGARSAFVTQRLIEMGYINATNIYDAFRGWVVAGYPVYNRHGEFVLKPKAFEKQDHPYIVD
jgi:rhodanese-related sulfurtransferase